MKNFSSFFILLLTFTTSLNAFSFISENNLFSNIIVFSDSNFYGTYLYLNNNGRVENFFVVRINDKEGYIVPSENFISVLKYSKYYPLMKMDFPFLEFKKNVVPYLHPNFVIKLLFLLDRINYSTRISDAMRSPKEQLIYKRRGWTDVLVSPHIIGLAADFSYYSGSERQTIMKHHQSLNLRYLEHGGKYNKHIHLQDNEIWKPIKKINEKIILSASDELNERVYYNNQIVKSSIVEYLGYEVFTGLNFEFSTESLCLVKISFENNIGEKKAEIITGVFETGRNNIYVKYDFLKKGVYRIKFYINNYLTEEKCIVSY